MITYLYVCSEDSVSVISSSIQCNIDDGNNNYNDNNHNDNNKNKSFIFSFFLFNFAIFFGFISLLQKRIPTNACIIY